jgi:hypothetical protein
MNATWGIGCRDVGKDNKGGEIEENTVAVVVG